jgi:Tfp pilus assembly protein PilW
VRRAASRRLLRDESGFTLFELLVAMPLMLIVMGGLTLMLTTITHWSSHTQEEATLQAESRSAVNVFNANIRGAFIGDGTSPIISATATSITFYTPDQYSTTVSGSVESSFHLLKVSYQVTGGQLQRQYMTSTDTYPTAPNPSWHWPGSMGPWMPVIGLSGSITNTNVFSYYTQAGAQATPPTPLTFPIADPSGVRAVGINLTLSTGGSQPQTFNVTDVVSLREMDN